MLGLRAAPRGGQGLRKAALGSPCGVVGVRNPLLPRSPHFPPSRTSGCRLLSSWPLLASGSHLLTLKLLGSVVEGHAKLGPPVQRLRLALTECPLASNGEHEAQLDTRVRGSAVCKLVPGGEERCQGRAKVSARCGSAHQPLSCPAVIGALASPTTCASTATPVGLSPSQPLISFSFFFKESPAQLCLMAVPGKEPSTSESRAWQSFVEPLCCLLHPLPLTSPLLLMVITRSPDLLVLLRAQ